MFVDSDLALISLLRMSGSLGLFGFVDSDLALISLSAGVAAWVCLGFGLAIIATLIVVLYILWKR